MLQMINWAIACVIARQQAAVGMCQDVDPEVGVAVVGPDLPDQPVQPLQGTDIVQPPVVQKDVKVFLPRFDRLTRSASGISAGPLQRLQDLTIEIAPETLPEYPVGADTADGRVERVLIEFDLEPLEAAQQQLGRGPGPDLFSAVGVEEA